MPLFLDLRLHAPVHERYELHKVEGLRQHRKRRDLHAVADHGGRRGARHDDLPEALRLRQFLEPKPGEKVLLVDDILRTGTKLTAVKNLVEANGGEVVGLAVVIYEPAPGVLNFGRLPFYYLAKLDGGYFKDAASCDLCKMGVPITKVWG